MAANSRLVLPDIWRGVAVIAMVLYHLVFIGWYGFAWELNPTIGIWRVIARLSGWSFLFVAGWSAWLLLSSMKVPDTPLRHKIVKRLGTLGSVALAISLVTLIFVPSAPIWWGILHGLTAALAVTYLLLWNRRDRTLQLLGVFTIAAGLFLPRVVGNWMTLPLGWPPFSFRSLDYYPLMPYGGIVWIAAGWGADLTQLTTPFERELQKYWPGKRVLIWIGQHSLLIYLGHVPILWTGLWILSQI